MDPNAFVAEVYRRMADRHSAGMSRPTWHEMENDSMVLDAVRQYEPYLPGDRTASILELGIGGGWFIAACLKLGYQRIYGADFGIDQKQNIREWAPDRVTLLDIASDIGEFLADKPGQFEFIHLSHVIEHIPKYSLFWVVDALYRALKQGGSVFLRTPNMEGPCSNSSFYVTLSHEYGFSGSNLMSLLSICGFDDVRIITIAPEAKTLKQRFGKLLRWPFLKESAMRHRLFGVNQGGAFGAELVVTGKRGPWPPYFDRKFK